MSSFKLLSTKKISPSLIFYSGLKGIEIMVKEFIKISSVNEDELTEKIKKLLSAKSTVAFTSKNAVISIASIGTVDKTSLPDWKIYCLDGITFEEVTKHFSKDLIEGTARNAKSLASTILNNSIEKNIIFFCGNKRRDELPDILKNNGFEVEELVVYETQLSPVKIVDQFDAIAFFSPSAVESFFSINSLDQNVICFSVGQTTTAALKKYAPNRILTSEKPSEENLMDLVTDYVSSPPSSKRGKA